jgi:hypothetical protein
VPLTSAAASALSVNFRQVPAGNREYRPETIPHSSHARVDIPPPCLFGGLELEPISPCAKARRADTLT